MKMLLKKPDLKIENYGKLMSNFKAVKLQAQYRFCKN